jgi:hypothetical protein
MRRVRLFEHDRQSKNRTSWGAVQAERNQAIANSTTIREAASKIADATCCPVHDPVYTKWNLRKLPLHLRSLFVST